MNKLVQWSLLMSAHLLLCTLGRAQITITQADVNRILTPGNQVATITDSSYTTVNIGTVGSTSNNWDFSALRTSSFQVLRSVAASGTPHIGTFPGATHAFRLDTSISGINGSIYQYLQLTSTSLINMGAMARATPFPGVTVELRVFVTPNEIVYRLPATMTTNWATAFTNRTLVTLSGTVLSDVSNTHNARYVVDAAGTMRLPGGGRPVYALRVRKINFYNGGGVGGYIFLSRGGAVVQFETYDTTTTSGAIPVTRGKTIWNPSIVADSTTDVLAAGELPTTFALKQNYPNPFNPTTRIEYQLPKEAFVSLKVYNLIGQEVATLVNQSRAAGTYITDWNAEGLPSGMYFYKMQAGAFSSTRRMMVVK